MDQLSQDDHSLVTQAVSESEKATNGEIVTIVTQYSDSYKDIGGYWATGITFLFLSTLAIIPGFYLAMLNDINGGWGHMFAAPQIMAMVFFTAVILFLIVRYLFTWMPLLLTLTPKNTKIRRVRSRAIGYFKVSVEKRTAGRSGILIYVSLGERRAEIVADKAIAAKVAPEVWGEAMSALIDEIRAGNPAQGIAHAARRVGKVLNEHFPRTADDVNELPDRLIEL